MKRNLLRLAGKRGAWGFPYLIFMLIFVLLPLILVGVYAFTDHSGHFTLANFGQFFSQSKDINTFLYSLGIAIVTTLICILIGYPIAFILSNANLCKSEIMVMLFILPMWVNVLVRTLATVALFG
ncbi:MAG: ABC transporter permease, partial [Bacteroidales bacterium]|nr:ABC transporter permease [Bacteroidales bacterium]